MNVLMISGDRAAAAGRQGAFWYTLEEFSKYWDRVDVLCPRLASSQFPVPSSLFDNVFFHPNPSGIWSQKSWITEKGEDLINEHKHNIMTVHEYPPFYNGSGAILLHKTTGIPFVLEVHHLVGWPKPASLSECIAKPLSRLVLPKKAQYASAIRVVNSSVRSTLLDWGVEEKKVHIVPSFYLDENRLQQSYGKKNFDIVFVGRLVPNKRLDCLLITLQKLPGATALVIGDGPQKMHYEAMARSMGIAERVRFIGWLPTQEDVLAHMQQARILVMCSASEGGPRVVLEAMAVGMPVLVTPVGVLPDVLKNSENGLITTGAPDDMAEKIALLLSDDAWRERMGSEAKKMLERFNRTILLKQYADFLKSVAQ